MRRSIISEEEKKFILERHRSYGYNSSWKDFDHEDESNDDEIIFSSEPKPSLEMTEIKMETIDDLKKAISKLDQEIRQKREELKKALDTADNAVKKDTKEGEFDDLIDADMDIEADSDSMEQGDY